MSWQQAIDSAMTESRGLRENYVRDLERLARSDTRRDGQKNHLAGEAARLEESIRASQEKIERNIQARNDRLSLAAPLESWHVSTFRIGGILAAAIFLFASLAALRGGFVLSPPEWLLLVSVGQLAVLCLVQAGLIWSAVWLMTRSRPLLKDSAAPKLLLASAVVIGVLFWTERPVLNIILLALAIPEHAARSVVLPQFLLPGLRPAPAVVAVSTVLAFIVSLVAWLTPRQTATAVIVAVGNTLKGCGSDPEEVRLADLQQQLANTRSRIAVLDNQRNCEGKQILDRYLLAGDILADSLRRKLYMLARSENREVDEIPHILETFREKFLRP
jgi:hypothetical protein